MNVVNKKKEFKKYLTENRIDIKAKEILDLQISNCNNLISELPDDIQEGVNELIDYILNRKN